MKFTYTRDLNILKAWLIGGQIDPMGGRSEGFQFFYDSETRPYSLMDVKEMIQFCISEYGDDWNESEREPGFSYYGHYFRFKPLREDDLNFLTTAVWNTLIERRRIKENEKTNS